MKIVEIEYSTHFKRALKKIPPALASEMDTRIQWFRANCFDPRLKTHKLKGNLSGLWAFSITHAHRIIFAFSTKNSVEFYTVGTHSIYN